jgi:hypothetical protein
MANGKESELELPLGLKKGLSSLRRAFGLGSGWIGEFGSSIDEVGTASILQRSLERMVGWTRQQWDRSGDLGETERLTALFLLQTFSAIQ